LSYRRFLAADLGIRGRRLLVLKTLSGNRDTGDDFRVTAYAASFGIASGFWTKSSGASRGANTQSGYSEALSRDPEPVSP